MTDLSIRSQQTAPNKSNQPPQFDQRLELSTFQNVFFIISIGLFGGCLLGLLYSLGLGLLQGLGLGLIHGLVAGIGWATLWYLAWAEETVVNFN